MTAKSINLDIKTATATTLITSISYTATKLHRVTHTEATFNCLGWTNRFLVFSSCGKHICKDGFTIGRNYSKT